MPIDSSRDDMEMEIPRIVAVEARPGTAAAAWHEAYLVEALERQAERAGRWMREAVSSAGLRPLQGTEVPRDEWWKRGAAEEYRGKTLRRTGKRQGRRGQGRGAGKGKAAGKDL